MESENLKRAEELFDRAERRGCIAGSSFLTPAEQFEIEKRFSGRDGAELIMHGGIDGAERRCAFFLPFYMDGSELRPEEHFRCIRAKAGFGQPGHRDYLGAVLGLGIRREWIGDIIIDADTAYIICLPTVAGHLTASLDKVGRYGVKTEEIELSRVPLPERQVKQMSFSVKSLRVDAVLGGMFGISRSQAQEALTAGLVSLNYSECVKADAAVRAGDIISLRGKGKGSIRDCGGMSKKGRIFVTAEILK